MLSQEGGKTDFLEFYMTPSTDIFAINFLLILHSYHSLYLSAYPFPLVFAHSLTILTERMLCLMFYFM